MNITDEVLKIIGKTESSKLEYKAVLPPSKNIAKLISSFANTDGGYIILGVLNQQGKLEINGLSDDFHANTITHRALDLLSPRPQVHYQYVMYNGKKLYVIKVERSDTPIAVENKIYKRVGGDTELVDPAKIDFKPNGYAKIQNINSDLEIYKQQSTDSKNKLIEHYQSILKIIDDLGQSLYPVSVEVPTDHQEGKILTRILFSSFVDNFETYLSDLLYEIFLADPKTLKSNETITVEEVLKCSDLQEFIEYLAKKKLGKLQKGSVWTLD